MGKIARYLNQLTNGDVFDAPEILDAYSVDRSALEIRPKLVAFPESTDDIRKLVRFSGQLAGKGIKLPITVWGSGLDKMGADLGNGMIISTEKMNKLLESDRRERLVRVQSGITLRELNTALSVNGLTIPIEGHDNETIGGLISNCPKDNLAGKYGGIFTFVERLEVVLPSGDILQTCQMSRHAAAKKAREKTSEGRLYNKILQLVKKNEPLIKKLRDSEQDLAGYQNIARVVNKSSVDLLPLFFGAQGTLGIITEVIIRAIPIQKEAKRIAIAFKDPAETEELLKFVKSLHPLKMDFYDLRAVRAAEKKGKKANEITKKMEDGFVILLKFDDKSGTKIRKIEHLGKRLPKTIRIISETNKTAGALNDLEKTLTSFVNHTQVRSSVPLMVGFSLPDDNMANFIDDARFLEDNLGMDLTLYGSYSANNYNLATKINPNDEDFRRQAANFLKTSAYIIKRQGGLVAGGLPEGRVKALVTETEMDEAEKSLYGAIKTAFDKQEILNPGVKINSDSKFTIRHFRGL